MPTGIYPRTKYHRDIISKSVKKRYASGEKLGFQKNNPSGCNKGRKFTKQWRENLSKSHKGYKMPEERRKKMSEVRKKEKGSNWKGGITPENLRIRNSIELRLWRESVFARDNWICQKCKLRGGKLRCHHIQNFSKFLELRTSIENGITFCKNCHDLFHKIYSKNNNTKEQIIKFLDETNFNHRQL